MVKYYASMKKISRAEFVSIKDFLKLSSVGEVMRSQRLSRATVSWVDASPNWEQYMEVWELKEKQKEEEFKKDTEKANESVYITPVNLGDIYEKLEIIEEKLDRALLAK